MNINDKSESRVKGYNKVTTFSGSHIQGYTFTNLQILIYIYRARGGVVVKALRYKPEGRVFDSRWYHWNFSVT